MPDLADEPNDLERLFVERANAGDVEGLVALYEPDAVIVRENGEVVAGHDQIRRFFTTFVSARPRLGPSLQSPAVISGDLALTSSRVGDGEITAEIARRQPEGHWLWVVDQFRLGKVK